MDKKYKAGDIVSGKVLKTNPFGLFVELDPEIHGLAHISELSDKPIASAEEIAKPGDVLKFKIISIEPKDHRLGLSLKAQAAKPKKEAEKEPKKPKAEEVEAMAEKKKTKEPKPKTKKTEKK